MELWDLYLQDRTPANRIHRRGEPIPAGLFHLVVHVWIRNRNGEYLISQRAADRPSYPLFWECVGGFVLQGEDSLAGALREVKEEVGIDLQPAQGELVFSRVRAEIDGKPFQDILDVWLFFYDGPVLLEQAITKEVTQVKWMTVQEIEELYQGHQLVETLGYFFSEPGVRTWNVMTPEKLT